MQRTAFFADFRRIADKSLLEVERLHTEAGLARYSIPGRNEAIRVVFDAYQGVLYQSAIAIVFSAMAAEGFIYDYAARNMSDSYVRNYLDKLDVVAKWLVVPRLVCGSVLASGGRGLELLRRLVKNRNMLVHYKSKVGGKTHFVSDSEMMELRGKAQEAILALDVIAAELDAIDPHAHASISIGANGETTWWYNG